ncbi:hypothetical protein [Rhodococcus sp. NPDC060176]|uniref:hypothetical protein n=1 Tax=Rhodococcus sp. NPDC060176 TaxID=3347062 RepID=UPI0036574C80
MGKNNKSAIGLSAANPKHDTPGYAERVQAEIEKMMADRASAAFEEYELRCLPAGSRFKAAQSTSTSAVDPALVGRAGIVLSSPPLPVTGRDGDRQ